MDSNHTYLAVITLGSAFKKDNSYYPQVVYLFILFSRFNSYYLQECKYIEKKKVKHIHDSLSDFSCSSDECDEELLSG